MTTSLDYLQPARPAKDPNFHWVELYLPLEPLVKQKWRQSEGKNAGRGRGEKVVPPGSFDTKNNSEHNESAACPGQTARSITRPEP